MSFCLEQSSKYPKKMMSLMMDSIRLWMVTLLMNGSMNPARNVGSRKKSRIVSPSDSTTARAVMNFDIFSLPNFFSSHWSNLLGSARSSSGK